jgi:comEA protein
MRSAVSRIRPQVTLLAKLHFFILAQMKIQSLDIGKREGFIPSPQQNATKEVSMVSKKVKFACILALCMGLAIGPVSALAQKSSPASADKINLNSATAEQLESLPGIGPAIAKSIVDHRTKIGKFNRIEEIMNVKGIGEKKFQKIKDRLVV